MHFILIHIQEQSHLKNSLFVKLMVKFPNSLKKALENHPTGLTDKSKAILEFMKSKNIDGNIMHGV